MKRPTRISYIKRHRWTNPSRIFLGKFGTNLHD